MVLSVVIGVYRYRKASIDSIDKFKFVVCTLLSLLIKKNVSVSVNISSFSKSLSWIYCDMIYLHYILHSQHLEKFFSSSSNSVSIEITDSSSTGKTPLIVIVFSKWVSNHNSKKAELSGGSGITTAGTHSNLSGGIVGGSETVGQSTLTTQGPGGRLLS